MRRILCASAFFILLVLTAACTENVKPGAPLISSEPTAASADITRQPESTPKQTPEPTKTPKPTQTPELPSPDRAVSSQERKSSNDLPDLRDNAPLVYDFDGDGTEEELVVTVEHLTPANGDNNPLRIKLVINDAEYEVEDYFNDGIRLYITDFNLDDDYIDFCLRILGTDIASTVLLCRYDGKDIVNLESLGLVGVAFEYDEKGSLFFPSYDDTSGEIKMIYDYISDVTAEERHYK